ncbi:TPA: dTDP-4-dehydrorhamnose 3,5-epimerase, partial [Neisseria meningitidis]
LIWNDPTVGIDWPLQTAPLLSPKDLAGKAWAQAEKLRLTLSR